MMMRFVLSLLLLFSVSGAWAEGSSLKKLPQGLGYPVSVRTGLSFIELQGINENEGNFSATVDMMMTWRDPRLAFNPGNAAQNFIDYNEEQSKERLEKIWTPEAVFDNQDGEPSFQKVGLRVYADGTVEYLQRTTAKFKSDFELQKFPFDSQRLEVKIVSRLEPTQRVALDFRQRELEFSNTRHSTEVDGWTLGLVELTTSNVPTWRGQFNTGLTAALVVKRDQMSLLATIFVPLFASLLIPLLVFWLNKCEDGEFQIDAFELTNISIGGLFAVVALNFTVNSSLVGLAVGDNPVMRLFGLNYAILGLSIAVGILLYRFNVVKRLAGPFIQEEFFVFLNWAVPLLVFSVATAMVAMALF